MNLRRGCWTPAGGSGVSTPLVDPPLVHITNNLLQFYKYLHFLNTRHILYVCLALKFDTEFYRIRPTRWCLHHFSTPPKQELYRISLIEKKHTCLPRGWLVHKSEAAKFRWSKMEVIIAVMPEWGEAWCHDHHGINWHAPSSASERGGGQGGPNWKAPPPKINLCGKIYDTIDLLWKTIFWTGMNHFHTVTTSYLELPPKPRDHRN
jgi:hypothetical protein